MDSTDMTGIRIGKTDADSALHTHYTVADSPGAAGDFLASLTPSDFEGYDPLNVTASNLEWIGRPDLNQATGRRRHPRRLRRERPSANRKCFIEDGFAD